MLVHWAKPRRSRPGHQTHIASARHARRVYQNGDHEPLLGDRAAKAHPTACARARSSGRVATAPTVTASRAGNESNRAAAHPMEQLACAHVSMRVSEQREKLLGRLATGERDRDEAFATCGRRQQRSQHDRWNCRALGAVGHSDLVPPARGPRSLVAAGRDLPPHARAATRVRAGRARGAAGHRDEVGDDPAPRGRPSNGDHEHVRTSSCVDSYRREQLAHHDSVGGEPTHRAVAYVATISFARRCTIAPASVRTRSSRPGRSVT